MGGDKDMNRNLILAAVLSMFVVLGWQLFLAPPPVPPVDPAAEGTTTTIGPDGVPLAGAPVTPVTREEALAGAPRVPVATPSVTGSISLLGARLDDLHLSGYRDTLEPGADTVILLNPAGAPLTYFAAYGWQGAAGAAPVPLPGEDTLWQVESGDTLAPGKPVTLRWDNGAGLVFRLVWSVDERYMFSVAQSVENTGAAPVVLTPYAQVVRRGLPETTDFYILHLGSVGSVDGELHETDYSAFADLPPGPSGGRLAAMRVAANGWLGFTDKYWMTALIPKPGTGFDAFELALGSGEAGDVRVMTRLDPLTIAPGAVAGVETSLFAGAKELTTIRGYEETLGIDSFDYAIDWGWFYFLTKPIASVLSWLNGLTGNMGVAIITLTLIIKALLFPLAYKSFVSMSRMKKLQPEMLKIKERVGEDKQKMQQEMIALYKREKVNPAAGCLPILLQIPIFFSLYKVIFVTIELRHAPFFGWIQDLSAPDPTSWMNLFGAIPFEVPAFLSILSIGIWPILMGITMWLQQKLNPAPPDPTQAMIFAWMPWIFMFMLGHFASGLVIYWCANNIITFTQQFIIMRSQGVEVDFLGNVKKSFKRKKPAA